ncbi:unnamed protein product [Albugo candida]|uniref:Uncharacterized protein n=1 Tax=Albugo candida TaxID=65357 RepID=A0A024FVE8_9STRA|nr:unnamed protein product [Albugo candida]|eukprot:CCI10639.1 unnamed protein product [Albugo candida]
MSQEKYFFRERRLKKNRNTSGTRYATLNFNIYRTTTVRLSTITQDHLEGLLSSYTQQEFYLWLLAQNILISHRGRASTCSKTNVFELHFLYERAGSVIESVMMCCIYGNMTTQANFGHNKAENAPSCMYDIVMHQSLPNQTKWHDFYSTN